MSNSNFESFSTNIDYNQPMWSSFSSSQSTQATDVSDNYPNPNFQQTTSNIEQFALLKGVGYGAPDVSGTILPNPNASVRPVYEPSVPGPSPHLQPQNYVYSTAPWFANSQAYASYPYPMPNCQRTSTQGPANWLAYQPTSYNANQSPSATSLSTSNDGWSHEQTQYMRYQGQAPYPVLPHQSSTSSSQLEKLPVPRNKPRAESDEQTTKLSLPCPKCNERFSRLDVVKRHISTVHTGKNGPFWLCDICGWWEFYVREAKIRVHCREDHPDYIDIDLRTGKDILPYRQVTTVGDQEFEPKVSPDGKRTRRRKKRVSRSPST